MAEDKDKDKPGGWFPYSNQLLLVLLAGTLFVTQTPFHDSRPDEAETIPHSLHPVHSRTWQDPFEEVDKYIEEHKNEPQGHMDDFKPIQQTIVNKIKANRLNKINVVVVMLPGAHHFEDSETRRRLRYAVLSGFNAALRYMPETPDYIRFFITNNKAREGLKNSYVAYEWMVYKPTNHKEPPAEAEDKDVERRYERPPVLLLWLNGEDFSVTPHQNLKKLINTLAKEQNGKKSKIGEVSVLGPYDSDGLQDLVSEMATPKGTQADKEKLPNNRYAYFSPTATVQDCNLLHDVPEFSGCNKLERFNKANLQTYFSSHGLPFLRVTATDLDLASSIKSELKLRGIEPSEKDRILLIGEWDSLYDWHLSNTFAGVILADRDNYCKGKPNENVQNWDELYDLKNQCVFLASYLRGLDGEKQNTGLSKKSTSNQKKAGEAIGGKGESIETASGDSQFDYVRRLAAQIEKLDQEIRSSNSSLYNNTHTIKAIGILGSDVYDKLLISEALHSKFPDAVFFTNGMDARFLEPAHNEWARNMVMVSSFGLQLDRYLQNGIPPFRDNNQTAFFLAAEMALARQFKDEEEGAYKNAYLKYGEDLKSLLRTSRQTDYDEKLFYDGNQSNVRIFELGRTQAFDLSLHNSDCISGKTCLHPEPDKNVWSIGYMEVIFVVISSALIFIRPSSQFLWRMPGLYFSIGMALMCVACLVLAFWGEVVFRGDFKYLQTYCMFVSFLLAIIYAFFMYIVAIKEEKISIARRSPSHKGKLFNLNILLSLLSLAVALVVIWFFVQPQGWLDGYEPYALFEGVSMWPSQAIRLVAVVLAGCFAIKVMRFPSEFTSWLKEHFCLVKIEEGRRAKQSPPETMQNFAVLHEWIGWKVYKRKRNLILGAAILFIIEIFVLWFFGIPNVPSRGNSIFSLNFILLQGLLVPAALILLVVVSDALIAAVNLVERCFPDDSEANAKWPPITLENYAMQFNLLYDKDDLSEWVGMRFIVELTRHIYKIIGYPLVIVLLIVLGCFSYFDNWEMPVYIKIGIGLSLVWLLFWDLRLKKMADNARGSALKSLRARAICYQQGDADTKTRGGQLEKLIGMIESYEVVVYKSFTQRPIFLNSLLIMIALLAGSVD
ncbi:MAG TPA: hypothetical protein VIF86_03505 [Methylobacter sp.]